MLENVVASPVESIESVGDSVTCGAVVSIVDKTAVICSVVEVLPDKDDSVTCETFIGCSVVIIAGLTLEKVVDSGTEDVNPWLDTPVELVVVTAESVTCGVLFSIVNTVAVLCSTVGTPLVVASVVVAISVTCEAFAVLIISSVDSRPLVEINDTVVIPSSICETFIGSSVVLSCDAVVEDCAAIVCSIVEIIIEVLVKGPVGCCVVIETLDRYEPVV